MTQEMDSDIRQNDGELDSRFSAYLQAGTGMEKYMSGWLLIALLILGLGIVSIIMQIPGAIPLLVILCAVAYLLRKSKYFKVFSYIGLVIFSLFLVVTLLFGI